MQGLTTRRELGKRVTSPNLTWLTVRLAGRISGINYRAAVTALPLPGLLLIRAALSQQSSKQCTDVKAQEVVSDVQAGK